MRLFFVSNAYAEADLFALYLDAHSLADVSENFSFGALPARIYLHLFKKEIRVQPVRVEESVADVYLRQRIIALLSRGQRRVAVQRLHMDEPAKVVKVVRF